jgi:hypothetical protein
MIFIMPLPDIKKAMTNLSRQNNRHEPALTEVFKETLRKIGRLPPCAGEIDIRQVNLGYRCNLACKNSHVQAGP